MPKQPSIFINYRRDECRDKAIILRIILELHFGKGSIFLDEKSIKLGRKWEEEIEQAVEGAEAVLSLIHDRWHADSFDSGLRRLDSEKDWVRREIISAKKKEIPLIPILIDGAEKPKDEWLPEEIRGLFGGQGVQLDFKDLSGEGLDTLIKDLKGYVTRWKVKDERVAPDENSSLPLYYQEAVQQRFPLPKQLHNHIPDIDMPFVGLKPFSRDEARVFFGRSREIYELCYKIIHHEAPRILLLDGYSGTGKSSLLQAGIIPRIEAQGWAVAYGRREEDKLEGLSGVFQRLTKELKAETRNGRLLILDQVEEAINNPMETQPNELEEVVHLLSKAVELEEKTTFILGFRSEHTARIKKLLSDYGLEYDSENTLFPLDRNGLLEAISGASRDKELRKKKYPLFFKPPEVSQQIADRLLGGKLGYYIAPLLQVNMQILWKKGKQEDGTVDITGATIENLIDTYEKLLNHYLAKVRSQISTDLADDYEVMEVLHLFVDQKPASATRLEAEILQHQETVGERRMTKLLTILNEIYLLTQLDQGDQRVTRLTHDVLAEEIQKRYDQLKTRKLDESLNQSFDLLLKELNSQMQQLQYDKAQKTVQQLMEVGIRREELTPYFFELLFFWNECSRKTSVRQILQFWLNSNLLEEASAHRVESLLKEPGKAAIQVWLRTINRNRYTDLYKKYFAPPDTCMVKVPGGTFQREGGGATKVNSFRIANIQTTFRKYGLYLYAIGEEKRLKEMAPSWGVHADHPVVKVNWYDVVEYCNWLSEAQGLEKVYTIDKKQKDPNNQYENDNIKWLVTPDFKANGYRLPTEAEWEFAARGGNESKGFEYAGSNDLNEVGWYDKNSGSKTHPVAQKLPNELGLYDMSGNAFEWCWDWKADYPNGPQQNPRGPEKGQYRVLRGGSWDNDGVNCRVDDRLSSDPSYRNYSYGFRLTQGLPFVL